MFAYFIMVFIIIVVVEFLQKICRLKTVHVLTAYVLSGAALSFSYYGGVSTGNLLTGLALGLLSASVALLVKRLAAEI